LVPKMGTNHFSTEKPHPSKKPLDRGAGKWYNGTINGRGKRRIGKGTTGMDRILPTGDLAFKKVLGSEENKDILAGFIDDFFGVKAEDITIDNPYSIAVCRELLARGEVTKLRQTLKDVAATFRAADFVAEVQIKRTSYYEERSLYYPFERFVQNYARVDAVRTGEDSRPVRYSGLRPVYAMNVLGYRLFGEDEDALRIFELYDLKRGKKFKDLLKIGFFELEKEKIETANQKHWRDYFVGGTACECAPEYIKKASKVIDYVNMSEEERKVISAMERMEANDEAERYYIATENRAIGRAEGEAIGEARGEAIKNEMIKNLLSLGIPISQIAQASKLSEKDIQEALQKG